MAKLALVFDCFCCEPKNANGQGAVLEAFCSVVQYLLEKKPPVGNSMVELLIRVTLDFHPKFSQIMYANLVASFRVIISIMG
jgi:hypothetical protein